MFGKAWRGARDFIFPGYDDLAWEKLRQAQSNEYVSPTNPGGAVSPTANAGDYRQAGVTVDNLKTATADEKLDQLLNDRPPVMERHPPGTLGQGLTDVPHTDQLPQQFGIGAALPAPGRNSAANNNNIDLMNVAIPDIVPAGNNVPFRNSAPTVTHELDNTVNKADFVDERVYNPNLEQQVDVVGQLKKDNPNVDSNVLPSQSAINLPWWLRAAGHIAPVAIPVGAALPGLISDESSDSKFGIDAGVPMLSGMAAGGLATQYGGNGFELAGRKISPSAIRGAARLAGVAVGLPLAHALSGQLPMGGYDKPDIYARELNRSAMDGQISPSDYAYEMDKVIAKKREDSPDEFSPYYGQLAQQAMVNQLYNSQSRPYSVGF